MTWLVVLAAIVLGAQLLTALGVWLNHRFTPELAAEAPLADADAPSLLVVVPARNEARCIAACVRSILDSRYPRLALRLVDDCSSDGTADIARAAAAAMGQSDRLEIVAGREPPPGWLGKNHALHLGTRDATAEYLLFLDADLRVAPDCIARAIAAAVRRQADLTTVIPRIATVGPWELAAQSLIAQLLWATLPAREINDPRRKQAAAMGPFLLFRRASYERLGGHEAVRGDVVEDLALARRTKEAGLRLVLLRGVGLASVQMYESLAALVRGWSKNFHVALGRALVTAPLVAAAVLLLYAGPFVLPVVAALQHNHAATAMSLAALGTAFFSRLDLARRYGVDWRGFWLIPVGAAVVAWILVRAAWRKMTGASVTWKGRAVK